MDDNTNPASTRADSATNHIAYTITTVFAYVSPDKLSGFFCKCLTLSMRVITPRYRCSLSRINHCINQWFLMARGSRSSTQLCTNSDVLTVTVIITEDPAEKDVL